MGRHKNDELIIQHVDAHQLFNFLSLTVCIHRVVRNTRNPVYDEDFTFYGLNLNELRSMSLHFVVLSFDRYSRDDVIGEVVCAMNTIDLQQIENQQVALSREIQPRRSLKVLFVLFSSNFPDFIDNLFSQLD